VDNFFEKRDEKVPKVENSSKKFLVVVDAFRAFVVQQREIVMQNQETTNLMGHVAEGLCRNFNLKLATKAKACKVASQE
jgi:hypothetical protein